jgi:hypothetical protein
LADELDGPVEVGLAAREPLGERQGRQLSTFELSPPSGSMISVVSLTVCRFAFS